MRLRLTVQRHGLPPARVLWTITAIRPPYSATGSEPTIAQLLEQINEIIPLESGDWGLEDYAVEVRGFECLHFSEAKDVLKEDDEVCIRPLGTSDLRIRKVSGRHQISSDGRHLVDGVAFGRPLLRQADRPPIRIPPRKRRRLTYDEDDEDQFDAQRQLVVHDDLESEKGSLSGSDDSEDSFIASDEEEDLHAELKDMRNDLDSSNAELQGQVTIGGSESAEERGLRTLRRRRTHKAQGLGLIPSSILADENGTPYPKTYNNPLLDIFADDESAGSGFSSLGGERREPAPDSIRPPKRSWRIRSRSQRDGDREAPDINSNNVGSHELELATPATVCMEPSDGSEDDDFEPPDHAGIGQNGSDKENATPHSQASTDTDEAAELAARIDSSFASESDSDTDETSSSGSSGSESSSSDSGSNDAHDTGKKDEASYQDTSSSGTSSSSDTSSDSEQEQPQPRGSPAKQAAKASTPKKGPPDDWAEGQGGERPASRAPVPPGAGRRTTQMRNQRRRDHKKMIRLRDAGKLPPNATIADLRKLEAELEGQPLVNVVGLDSAPNQSKDAHFEEKRQALLRAISTGGVELGGIVDANGIATVARDQTPRSSPESKSGSITQTKIATVEKSTSSSSEKTLVGTAAGAAAEGSGGQQREHIDADLATSQDDVQAGTVASSSQLNNEVAGATNPRMRLDMESSRRLLFGALGHRAPKTKMDEISLQAKLTREAQLPKKLPPPTVEENDTSSKSPPQPVESVRWEDKIELSAVECCHEGIKLSTPPFPFVQRWDPQQQRGYGHDKAGFSQGSKKRKRNNKHYEDSFEPLDSDTALRGGQRAASNTETYFQDATSKGNSEGQELLARNLSDENSQAANDQLLRETLVTYEEIHERLDPLDDLSHLSNDLSACPSLEQAACSAGTIIAFKQLDMSSETNWQPLISDYRTALIDSVLDDGTLLMRMALQDQPREGKQYDQDTGKRLYSKFEMPGYNEDESGENNGLLELTFADLIEPKLVRPSGEEPGSSRIEKPSSNGLLPVEGGVMESEQQSKNRGHSLSNNAVQQVLQDVRDLRKDAEVTEQVRKEIRDLIKDAGWHSSVQSKGDIQPEDPDPTYKDNDHEMTDDHENSDVPQDKGSDIPSSPRFNGFSSSPLAEEDHETEGQVMYPTLPDTDVPDPSSPYDGARSDLDRTMADTSSQVDREAIQTLRQDFEKELQRPIASSKDLDHCHFQSSDDCHNLASGELPPQEQSISPPSRLSTVQKTIPDSQPPPSSTSAHGTSDPFDDDDTVQTHNKHSSDNDDDDDLPDLNTVLSSFSSQRTNDIKPEHHSSDSDEAFLQTLPAHPPSQKTSISTSSTNRHNNKPPPSSAPARSSNIIDPKPTRRKPNKYEAAPRSSQDWIGTQVVDLTVSSDPVAMEMEEEEEGSSLPKGAGWVRKENAGGGGGGGKVRTKGRR
ncbi:MAG: hypothetical protein Q9182_000251 [Xanthomendoza sp. 2 TL-2023]